jgi:hypothetical protein
MRDNEEKLLDTLYLGVRDQADFDQALTLLCGMFDCASCALLDFDATRPEVSAHATVGVFGGENLTHYQRDFAAMDPAPPAFMKRPAGTAIPTYRLLPEEIRRPSVFFGEFFRPLGLEECLGGVLASNDGRFAMVGIHRAPDRRAFDDEDIAKLERLMPHLWRALQIRRTFLDIDRRSAALADACDRLAGGFVGVDDRGRAIFANIAARGMSSRDDGLALDRNGLLYAVDRAANQRLAVLARDVAAGGAGGVARVPRPHGKPAYVVMVAPLALEKGLDGGRTRARGTLYVIHDPLGRLPPVPELVAEMFKLPLGAATMLAALAGGQDLKDYAERTGISMNTVRFHLKTAYARTGFRRQAELVRAVTAALRDLADHRQRE